NFLLTAFITEDSNSEPISVIFFYLNKTVRYPSLHQGLIFPRRRLMADRSEGRRAIFAGALVITVGLAIGILCLSTIEQMDLKMAPDPVVRKPTGQPQLASIEELP
ncbi:MAG: hypothetical protein DMG14_28030, partial [Acidobacteria bacterium]